MQYQLMAASTRELETMPGTNLDEQARRLVAAASEAVHVELQTARPGSRAIGGLYSRVRERLGQLSGTERLEDVAEDLALNIYLAWLAEEDPPGPGALLLLKASVERTLRRSLGEG